MSRITFLIGLLVFIVPNQMAVGALAPDEELPRVVREKRRGRVPIERETDGAP